SMAFEVAKHAIRNLAIRKAERSTMPLFGKIERVVDRPPTSRRTTPHRRPRRTTAPPLRQPAQAPAAGPCYPIPTRRLARQRCSPIALMLSISAKSLVDLGRAVFAGWKKRRNPARAQAQRLLDAFGAHGVQLPRLLPEAFALPNAAFADADDLKGKLTPALLDWAADTFAWRRGWMDGVDPQRHLRVDGYKHPSIYRDWLEQRLAQPLNNDRVIHVWVSETPPLGPQSSGPLCIAYEEHFGDLDDQELRRYWLLSNHWRLDHSPCTENLMALCAIAAQFRIQVIGHVARSEALARLDDGRLFVPELLAQSHHRWFPADLIDPPPAEDSEWRQALWIEAQTLLRSNMR